MSFVQSMSGLRRRRDLQTPAHVTDNPRKRMAERLPPFVQPFLTWLTAMPAPGEAPVERSALAFVTGALLWIAVGSAASAAPFFLAEPPLLAWLLVPAGMVATCSGLGLLQVVVFHHCSHNTVFGTRERNRAAGRLISAVLLFKRFDDYQREHMLHHSPNKLLTHEDEFANFVLGLCRLEPGAPKRVLWRRLAWNLVSPAFHARFLAARVRSSLLTGDRSHDLTGTVFWAGAFGAALAAGAVPALLFAWVLPVTVLLQIATVFRILCEHRFPEPSLLEARGKEFVCEATIGVFPGSAPPEASAGTPGGLLRWAAWWLEMLTVQLFVRVFVLVGDAPCHDFHHRRPATRRWTDYIHARQRDAEAGSPGFPAGYTESWGLFNAVDGNLATLAATPRSALSR